MESGTRLGPYEILEPLGAGGMGEVYRARDGRLDRDVAIKVLPAELAADPERLARLEREAKLLAQLEHPSIAAIYGLEAESPRVGEPSVRFLVMQLVEGATIADRLREAGPFPLFTALWIARQVAEGLEAAHAKGIVHRDLKPANVMVGGDVDTPQAKILDFGIAKIYDPAASGEQFAVDMSQSPTLMAATGTGVIMGTAAYMSPEQARGRPVDHRTDIWALGALLFEMLTGERAFRGETVTDVLAAIVKDEPDWCALPQGMPARVEGLLRRCLDKAAKQRLQHVGEVRIALGNLDEGDDAVAFTGVDRKVRGWLPAAVGLGGLLLGAVLGSSLLGGGESAVAPRDATHVEVTIPAGMEIENNRFYPWVDLAPDGRSLVFHNNREQGRGLQRVDFDDGSITPIPGAVGSRPFYSADGEWIAFAAERRLWKVPATGGTAIPIAEGVQSLFGGTWAPDGTIIFAPEATSGLYQVSDRGGEPVRISDIGYWDPFLLPDGKTALAVDGFGGRQIAVIDIETGESEELPIAGNAPQYVPSGHVIFARGTDLLATTFNPVTREVGEQSIPVVRDLSNGLGPARQFTVAGGTLAYITGGREPRFELVEVDMRGATIPLAGPADYHTTPRYSPDGSIIATRVRGVDAGHVQLLEPTSGSVREFTVEYGASFRDWHPDGQSLILAGRDEEVQYRQPIDGTSPEVVVAAADRGLPWLTLTSMSADTTRLVGSVESEIGHSDLAMYGTDPATPVTIIAAASSRDVEHYAGVVSPDGRRVAYVSDETGVREIYLTELDAPGSKQLVSGTADRGAFDPHWAPDGRALYYIQDDKMWRAEIPVESQAFIQSSVLFDATPFMWFADGNYRLSNWDLSPDGTRFLMTRAAEEFVPPPSIKVVFDFGEELERLLPSDAGSARR